MKKTGIHSSTSGREERDKRIAFIISPYGEHAEELKMCLLERKGINAKTFQSIESAMHQLHHGHPDVVLIDDKLSEQSVISLVSKCEAPVVAMTGEKGLLSRYTKQTGYRAVSRNAPIKRIAEHVFLAVTANRLGLATKDQPRHFCCN